MVLAEALAQLQLADVQHLQLQLAVAQLQLATADAALQQQLLALAL